LSGSFTVPGDYTAGGSFGDFDLPTLSGDLVWDVSAFSTHGIIAVSGIVPEPSRALLLMFGLFFLGLRRRRA